MAINKKIIEKISEKTASDIAMQKNLMEILTGIEEGRQGKRIIERMLKSI